MGGDFQSICGAYVLNPREQLLKTSQAGFIAFHGGSRL